MTSIWTTIARFWDTKSCNAYNWKKKLNKKLIRNSSTKRVFSIAPRIWMTCWCDCWFCCLLEQFFVEEEAFIEALLCGECAWRAFDKFGTASSIPAAMTAERCHVIIGCASYRRVSHVFQPHRSTQVRTPICSAPFKNKLKRDYGSGYYCNHSLRVKGDLWSSGFSYIYT